jgi:hypothetical protein
MNSFHMDEAEIERQLICDTDYDCGTESMSGEEAWSSESEVDEDSSSSLPTWGPPDQHGRRGVNIWWSCGVKYQCSSICK